MIRNVTSVFISVSVSVVVSVYLRASFQPLVSGIRTLIMLELMMQTTFRNPPFGQTSKHLHGDLQLESTMHKRLVPHQCDLYVQPSELLMQDLMPPLTGLEVLGIEEPEHVYVCTPASAFGAKSL